MSAQGSAPHHAAAQIRAFTLPAGGLPRLWRRGLLGGPLERTHPGGACSFRLVSDCSHFLSHILICPLFIDCKCSCLASQVSHFSCRHVACARDSRQGGLRS